MREKSPEEFLGAVFSLFPFLNLFVPGEFGDGIRHNRAGIQKASLTIRKRFSWVRSHFLGIHRIFRYFVGIYLIFLMVFLVISY